KRPAAAANPSSGLLSAVGCCMAGVEFCGSIPILMAAHLEIQIVEGQHGDGRNETTCRGCSDGSSVRRRQHVTHHADEGAGSNLLHDWALSKRQVSRLALTLG